MTSLFGRSRSAGSGGRQAPRRTGGPGPDVQLAWLAGYVGPILAVLGLIVVLVVSVGLMNGQLPTFGNGPGTGPGNSGNSGPVKTPTPSNVVQVDPRTNVQGSILYVKDGNIWVQTRDKATQLTNGGLDSQPVWSPDGSVIYFIRSRPQQGQFPRGGQVKTFDLEIPTLERMNADGSGVKGILTGRYAPGPYVWSFFIQQPTIAPDGKTAAIVTDGPNPSVSDIRVKFVNLETGAITDPRLPEVEALGQQDPAWSPDGRSVAYVKNAREGTKGAPTILRYSVGTKGIKLLTGPGYIQPAWSPDSRYIAATVLTANGTDIVIIDARTGAEVLRVTNDGRSFQPVWSPAGNAIVFQRDDRGVIDLWDVQLNGTGPSWQVGTTIALTISAGIDATSRQSWFIPADQLPTPAPTPVPSATPSGAASPAPS